MDFNPDFKDILSALNDAKVEYLVVGAYAVAAHGVPRATGDLDIWIRANRKNASQLVRALKHFGAPMHQIEESDFVVPSLVFQIGVPPGRIDILTEVTGLKFESAWENKVSLSIEGIQFFVIGKADLVTNKRAVGRPKDLADIAELTGNT